MKHALGLAKSFSNDLLFLDKDYGGYGVKNLWISSLSKKMEFIAGHIVKNDFNV